MTKNEAWDTYDQARCAYAQALAADSLHHISNVREKTLKEVGAWLRSHVGGVWTLERLHCFERGEMPK